jgi:predicted dehydrogenase
MHMPSLTRRSFAAAALAAPSAYGASQRLRAGVIGCGIRGIGSHIAELLKMAETENVQIAAVCDVFDKRARAAAARTGAKPYRDYRRLLEDKDIDFVTIATPDHLHASMSIEAARAGKHVYCEKPMTHTAQEAKRVVATIRETGVKMQVGVQGMSDDSYETANKYFRAGALGKVVLAQIDYSRNYRDDFWLKDIDRDARPGVDLDWDLFLGPGAKRPYDPDRFFNWIRYWDYSGGVPAGLLVHRVTRIIRSLGLTFPEYGSAHGGKFQFDASTAEIPETINISLDYPGGPTVQLISSMANDTPVPHLLRGHKATLEFTDSGFVIRPQKLYGDPNREIVHRKTGGEDTALHLKNLIDAIRSNVPLKCDATLGYYGVVACQFGILSYRQRKYMKWDSAAERIVPA